MQKNFTFLFLSLLFIGGCTTQSVKNKIFSKPIAKDVLTKAAEQYKLMVTNLPDYNLYPKTTSADSGSLETCNSEWWTSGFFPGALWYLYEFTTDTFFLHQARLRTAGIEKEKYNTYTHDLGFMLYCSYGNGIRITGDTSYKSVLITGANSLASRYNDTVGCIQSWDANEKWDFPVIIDNMMNLEFLFWASKTTKDPKFAYICKKHALTTLKNHFRDDYSSYHLVDYNPATGTVQKKQTVQGWRDESSWARGQAWGLYGYTVVFRETRDSIFLNQAQKIADYIISHPNYPSDGVPYWDFNAPGETDTLRDASAGAVIASALLELVKYSPQELKEKYYSTAEKILKTLSSDSYFAKKGTNNNFILKHGVGNLPEGTEVDLPLSYADYYFIEALIRYINLNEFD